MKKRFLVLFTMIFVFGLFGAVFAFSGTSASAENSMSCPMQETQKSQSAGTAETAKVPITFNGDDCCKPGADCCKGGSCCPRKKK